MPTFCRHNRLLQNCPICSREQSVEMRPLITSSAPKVTAPRRAREASRGERSARGSRGAGGGVRVRHLDRGADDGYGCGLVPGLRSSAEAERLADELAFAAQRLALLETDPPGLLAEVAGSGDLEERTWLAFLIAYLGPLDGPEPFASIERARVGWAAGEPPPLDEVQVGPRGAHDPARGLATISAYRAWADRAGSQQAAFTGESSWNSERRFDRVFERLALPGLHRDARYELLVLLGRLGLYELRAGRLNLVGDNPSTVAAKRALGIGDPYLLERRAADLAAACEVPLEALDLAFFNWERGERTGGGMPADLQVDQETSDRCRDALEIDRGLSFQSRQA
jgi:hypothetical protein